MNIDITNLLHDINQFEKCIENLHDDYKKVLLSVRDLKNGWEGEKAQKFYNNIENTYLVELYSAIQALEEYYNYISKVPKTYEIFDESYSSKEIKM